METQNRYIPGVCNIGPEEISRRRNLGWVAFGITIALLIVLWWIGVNPWWRLFIFLPAMISASGFLQAHFGFCSGFARAGVFNFGSLGQTQKTTDEFSKVKDKKKGNQITLYAIIIGIIVTIIAILV